MGDPGAEPTFFTVEEAARILRIGRTAAYALTRQWRVTGGEDGLPVVRFGRQLRVPRVALERLAGAPLAENRPETEGGLHHEESHGRSADLSRLRSDASGDGPLQLWVA